MWNVLMEEESDMNENDKGENEMELFCRDVVMEMMQSVVDAAELMDSLPDLFGCRERKLDVVGSSGEGTQQDGDDDERKDDGELEQSMLVLPVLKQLEDRVLLEKNVEILNSSNSAEEEPKIKFVHVKTHRQRRNNSCGYYSLYNSMSMLRVALASTEQDKLALLESQRNPAMFWFEFQAIQKHLLKRCELELGWPWTKEEVLGHGLMERSYLRHLVESYPPLLDLEERFSNCCPKTFRCEKGAQMAEEVEDAKKKFVTVMYDMSTQVTVNGLMSWERIKEIGEIWKDLSRSGNNGKMCQAFPIGCFDHWFSMFFHRIDDRIEVMVLDSRNFVVVEQDDEQLSNEVVRRLQNHDRNYTSGDLERDRVDYVNSLKVSAEVMHLITEGLTGKLDFVQHEANAVVHSFHRIFEKHAVTEVEYNATPNDSDIMEWVNKHRKDRLRQQALFDKDWQKIWAMEEQQSDSDSDPGDEMTTTTTSEQNENQTGPGVNYLSLCEWIENYLPVVFFKRIAGKLQWLGPDLLHPESIWKLWMFCQRLRIAENHNEFSIGDLPNGFDKGFEGIEGIVMNAMEKRS